MQNEPIEVEDYNAPLYRDLTALEEKEAPVSPDNPPWGIGQAVMALVFSVAAILVFPAGFVLPYVVIYKDGVVADLQNDPTAIVINLLGIVPAHLLSLAVAWYVVTQKGLYKPAETLGFENGGFRWWHHIMLLGGFFVLAGFVGYLIPEGDNELMRMLRSSRTAVYITAALATVTAPVVEEVIYRGILYPALKRRLGMLNAVIFVTGIFTLVHVPQYWGSPGTIFLLTALSLCLTMVRARSGMLWPCILLHFLFNGIQSAALIAEPFLPAELTQPAAETAPAIISRLWGF